MKFILLEMMQYIDSLYINDIEKRFVSYAPGTLCKQEFVGSLAVEINRKANTVHHNPNADNREYLPFKWLSYGHIAYISFELEDDDRKYRFPVTWSDTPSVNEFQKNYILSYKSGNHLNEADSEE